MYISLGGEKVVRAAHVIAIFDMYIQQSSKISNQFIAYHLDHKKIEVIGNEQIKSLVITKDKIYYSPISSATLKKRANKMPVV